MTAELDAARCAWLALWLESRGGEVTVLHLSDLEDAFRSGWEEAMGTKRKEEG